MREPTPHKSLAGLTLYALICAAAFLIPFLAHAQNIPVLPEFTSTTSPTTAITQRTFGKDVYLTGFDDGCLYLVSGILTVNLANPTCTGGGGGAGSGTVSTSTPLVAGQVAFSTSVSTIGNDSDFLWSTTLNRLTAPYASTTALSIGSDFVSDLNGTGLSLSAGGVLSVDLGTSIDISSETNLSATAPIRLTGDTLDWTGLATSSQPSSSNLLVSNGSTGVYGVGTTTLTATSPLSLSQPISVIGSSASALSLDTSGTWTGNAGTATALAANGANCSSGSAPLGVDASGAVESCFDVWTEAENTSAAYAPQSRQLTIGGTAKQITSSAGAQTLAADRTWTLSLPSHVEIQSSLFVPNASTTNATSTGSLAIPADAAPNTAGQGRIAYDTTSGNVTVGTTTTNTHVVIGSATTTLYAFDLASTSPRLRSGGVQPFVTHFNAQVVTGVICKVTSGTSVVVNLSDGTNDTNTVTCTTTETQYAITSNNTFTARERIEMEVGTVTGSVDSVSVRWIGYRTSD